MKNYTALAIHKLKPNSSWRFENYDYSTIEWFELEGTAPTQSEINTAIEQIKAEEAQAEITRVQAKADLLARLGITEDEARLLLS